MSDFAFKVEGDASKADRELERVLTKLDRIEAEARQTGIAMTAGFAQTERAAQRTADALQKVSTSMASMQNAAKGAAAMFGIGLGARELLDVADGYTNIQNRLRQMAPDQAAANALFAELHGIANRTRSDISATVDAYAGMTRATKALGLSQDETLRVTETLNKLVTASGKSAGESAAGLMQFSQALSSGRLQGDELRSVFENMPSLVDALMASLGKTQAELREMGSRGEITSAIMIKALQGASGAANEGLAKTIPTISQQITVLKNNITASLGPSLQSATTLVMGLGKALGSVNDNLGGLQVGMATAAGFMVGGPFGAAIGLAIDSAGELAKRYGSATNSFDEMLKNATESIDGLITGTMGVDDLMKRGYSAVQAANAVIDAQAVGVQNYQLAIEHALKSTDYAMLSTRMTIDGVARSLQEIAKRYEETRAAAQRFAGAIGGGAAAGRLGGTSGSMGALGLKGGAEGTKESKGATGHLAKETDEYAKALAEVLGPQREAAAQLSILGNLYMNGAINLEQYTRAAEKHKEVLRELGILNAQSVTSGMATPVDYTAGIDTSTLGGGGYIKAAAFDHEALTKSWMDRMEAMQQANRDLADSFAPIGDALQEVFMKGEASLQSLDNALRGVALNMFKFMALQAAASLGGTNAGFAGSIIGGIFGGAPGMATGGVVYAAPGGGTDSQLLAIRKSPNEAMTAFFETPGQLRQREMGGGGGGSGAVNVQVHYHDDRRELVRGMLSNEGRSVLVEMKRDMRRMGRDYGGDGAVPIR